MKVEAEDDTGKYDFTKFLLDFREMGVVTIVDVARGIQVLHSSIHDR